MAAAFGAHSRGTGRCGQKIVKPHIDDACDFMKIARDTEHAPFKLDPAAWEAGITSPETFHAISLLVRNDLAHDFATAHNALYDRFFDDYGNAHEARPAAPAVVGVASRPCGQSETR
jgi:hypothetical protein